MLPWQQEVVASLAFTPQNASRRETFFLSTIDATAALNTTCGADLYRDWAAAELQLAVDTEADGDAAIDDVYGEDGDYDTWQSAISDAESAYETAASAAWGGLQKSLAAHDAALESALADTYADALEQLAVDYPSPWSTRAAADARAESDKIAADQSAQSGYADSVNDANIAFDTALATAAATRTESQAAALRTSLQTQSEAAVTSGGSG